MAKVIFGDCLLGKREQFFPWTRFLRQAVLKQFFGLCQKKSVFPVDVKLIQKKPINNENPKRCLRLNCLLRTVPDILSLRRCLCTVPSRMLICPGQNCTLRACLLSGITDSCILMFKPVLWAWFRVIESLRLEKTSEVIKSNCQPITTMPAKPYPKVPPLHIVLNTSRDGDSLGSMFQFLTTLSVKKCFLISNLNLP